MLRLKESDFNARQLEFLRNSNKRINIASGSVRSSKTIAVIFRFLHYIKFGPPGNLLICGRTERTTKRNIIDLMQKIIGPSMRYNKGMGEIRVGDRLIYVCGANDERASEKIQGITLAGCMADEITIYPASFFKMLLSRLSVPKAQLFATCNADSPFHFLKKDYIDNKSLDLYNLGFNIDDNIFLDPKYVANLKKEYSGLYYQRYVLGLWVLADGTIYDMYDPNIHTYNSAEKQTKHIVGIDYGTSNPCAFLLFGNNDKEDIYLEREYYYDSKKENRQKTDEEYAQDLEKFLGDIKPKKIYIDPTASNFKATLRKLNKWNIASKVDNSVNDGISFISTQLKNGHLHIHKNCTNTIKEFASYIWDKKAQLRGEDKPLKQNDHAMDAMRYALYNHFNKNIQGKVDISMTKLFGGGKPNKW